jgi:inosine-uridine nucleoside N-ribohydrolase
VLPDPEARLIETHAAAYIVDLAREREDDLTLCFLGPATNLAVALLLEPDLPNLVSDVYVLAGAFHRTGNVTPAASFNAYSDPAATQRALDAVPKIVPLDVSERGILERSTLDALAARGGLSELAVSLLESYTVEQVRRKWDRDGAIASDTVLVADVLADILEYERGHVTVETSDVTTRGATTYDEHGSHDGPANAEVALDIDVEAYRKTVVSTFRSLEHALK